jgi:hypothetical protein
LTSTIDGGSKLHALTALTRGKITPCRLQRRLVGPRVGPEDVEKRKSFLCPELNPAVQSAAWGISSDRAGLVRVFVNRVLRRTSGPKRNKVTFGRRKRLKEALHDLYSSPSVIRILKSRRMRWPGHVARMGEKRNGYSLLVGKPEGKSN